MNFFRIEHKNCFREWVVAKDVEQAISFLELNRFHGENFSYQDVKAVEEETNFIVNRDGFDEWSFPVDSMNFDEWVITLNEPVLMRDSSDTYGHWFETVYVNGLKINVEFSSGIYEDDQEWVCLVWETKKGKEWKENTYLLATCSTFDHAKQILKERAKFVRNLISDGRRVLKCGESDILKYDYLLETRLLNELP